MNNKGFIRLAWATLTVIFLVIFAGSVVRATGSGMGCPDWPKCFGYFIPPTTSSQVHFIPNHQYKKGQMIIVDDELMKADEDFTSGSEYNPEHWQVHEKHDYATYNPRHTWVEYINRLLGAISGLFVLALLIYSIVLASKGELKWYLVALCFLSVVLLGFQAWLGRTVVDSNLEGSKITAHMFGALALIVVILLIIRFGKQKISFTISKTEKIWAWIAFIILVVQIAFGTDLRQIVDQMLPDNTFHELFKTNEFIVHRSFSWAAVISIIVLSYTAWKKKNWNYPYLLTLLLVVLEFQFGVILYLFDFPKFAQPLHLLGSNLLFASLFWICIAKLRLGSK